MVFLDGRLVQAVTVGSDGVLGAELDFRRLAEAFVAYGELGIRDLARIGAVDFALNV